MIRTYGNCADIDLFDLRQDADYGDMFIPTKELCHEAVGQAKQFVQQIKEHYERISR